MQLRRNSKKQDAEILRLKAELYNFLHEAKTIETQKKDVVDATKPAVPAIEPSSTETYTPEAPSK
jgi:hypothetical protein